MRLQITVTNDVDVDVIHRVLKSPAFANKLFHEIVGTLFPEQTVGPAEFMIEEPVRALGCVPETPLGIRLTLLEVRQDRIPVKTFHQLVAKMTELLGTALTAYLGPRAGHVQTCSFLMLDRAIETTPGSGILSTVINSEPRWVDLRTYPGVTESATTPVGACG
ncbi:MAG: hypothetical protein H6760_04205 [Candidatus Nomurabacteria bacterium]|nr:MAG: hypothetical protein H6760_04205 [Candidatus Nomurabacteria bacterium]